MLFGFVAVLFDQLVELGVYFFYFVDYRLYYYCIINRYYYYCNYCDKSYFKQFVNYFNFSHFLTPFISFYHFLRNLSRSVL